MKNRSNEIIPDLHTDRIERETLRVEIFSDAVFAIAITLLVLDFKIPENLVEHPLASLIEQIPSFVAYGLSFFTIGIYWITHHNLFNFIKRTNKTMMMLNLIFLMALCFLPYPTRLISMYNDQKVTTLLYGLNLSGMNLALYFFWLYVSHKHRLINKNISEISVRKFRRGMLFAIYLYVIGIALVFVNTHLALIVYGIVSLSIISHDWLSRLKSGFIKII
jgi:uncharacterized membrane protein